MQSLPRKAIWIGLTFFSALGPLSIYQAYLKFGSSWVSESFQAIWNDPIYTYAVADLCAIFTIVSYWIYLECKRTQRAFWYWPVLLFTFGSPALLLFKLSSSTLPRDK